MKDAIDAFGQDDHLVSGLLAPLAASALPAAGCAPFCLLFTPPPVRSGQGKHEQGEHVVHPHGPGRLLRWMAQLPFALGHIPTQPLRQVRRDLVPPLSHDPAPAVECLSATTESGPQINASAYGGTLGCYKKGGEQ
jgi:hypothetical protein